MQEKHRMKNKRGTGAEYEQKAAEYLESRGYEILCRNFRCRIGEIDLIARDGSYLVFVEVKYRVNARMGEPKEAVDDRKQRKISRTAAYYCMRHGISPERPCRFDVAAFTQGKWEIIQNAFDYIQ